MATNTLWKFVVWERQNKIGQWCPYSPEVSTLLEQNLLKSSDIVPLGDADDNLKIYSVHLKDLFQVSSSSGTKCKIRRRLCDCHDTICNGVTWQWHDDHDLWHIYDVDVNAFIEKAYQQGVKAVVLSKSLHPSLRYHYEIDFKKMIQVNKQTKRKRSIRRKQNSTPYPVTKSTENSADAEVVVPTCPPADEDEVVPTCPPVVNYSDLTKEVPGTTALQQQVNEYIENVKRTYNENSNDGSGVSNQVDVEVAISQSDNTELPSNVFPVQNAGSCLTPSVKDSQTAALVNGHPWHGHWPPHTHQSQLKPVPGIDPLPKCSKKPQRKKKKILKKATKTESDSVTVLEEYTDNIEIDPAKSADDQVCIICYESLCKGSSYDDDTSVVQLKICSHMFHKSCLTAMYDSGPKDRCLQCPVCKKIYGEKCGIQPPGNMIYHVLPYSLPGNHECDTIRIIYDISSGTQGPEHPNPGKKYTARGFPRHCYLPDNETGRKVLRLLIKAWKRRLIFTIGRSSTTCEEDTVTWNEIHHKTEFGCNKRGHGYPDPNYFNNVLSELEAHGIKDDDVYLWYPA